MSTSGLAAAGSSSYDSDTLHVGDGTWDSDRDTFLLPNLMGVNFATLRYNGMGNRFKSVAQYHSLIIGHGVIAAIVFLGIVPAAIMIAKFYHRNPKMALRIHIWLQIMTLLLTTVIFMLGYFAVGPKRSLTNPHHGIGLALYLMVIVQFISGWFVHRSEKNKPAPDVLPLKVMIHQWAGKAIALLGIAQIPMGLALYGSPAWLFALFALFGFTLFLAWFILIRWYIVRGIREYGSQYSYGARTEVLEDEDHRSHSGVGRYAAPMAAGATLAYLGNKFRRRSGHQRRDSEGDVVSSHRQSGTYTQPSESYIEEEKLSEADKSGLGKKAAGVGVFAGAIAAAKKLFGKKRREDDDVNSSYFSSELTPSPAPGTRPYRPAPPRTGTAPSVTEDSTSRVSRMEEGRPLASTAPLSRRSVSATSYTSYFSNPDEENNTARNAAVGLGAFASIKQFFKRRREAKEKKRLDDIRQQEIEAERAQRATNRRYTGDGYSSRTGRQSSYTSTADMSETTVPPITVSRPTMTGVSTVTPVTAAPASSLGTSFAERDRSRHTQPLVSGGVQPAVEPVPPIPGTQSNLRQELSASEVRPSTAVHDPSHLDEAAAVGAGLAAGSAVAGASHSRSRSRTRQDNSGSEENRVTSPPVSVKVKIRNDGREVTLRRLTEQEAAAGREARRRDHRARRRAESNSSLSGTDAGDRRWRRTEALERQQAEEMRRQQGNGSSSAAPSTVTPTTAQPATGSLAAPAAPPAMHIPSSIGSPGTYEGTTTETSNMDYASNRRRRRAERAQARQAERTRGSRTGGSTGGGSRVEFT
ncbi:MAG: hypothetical protein M1834_001689 [Cirrosporium novae-zelandiae]|nr:MAG: hypothetical protein M1834_001689 [Cirrosporium novae-zelandiae]